MKYSTITVLVIASVLFFVRPANADEPQAVLEGRIIGPDASTAGAYVALHDFSQGGQSFLSAAWEKRVASDGKFVFRLPAGCYDFFVSAEPLLPYTERICINSGETKKVVVKMKRDSAILHQQALIIHSS